MSQTNLIVSSTEMASGSSGFTSCDASAVHLGTSLGFALIISNDYSNTPELPTLTGTKVDAKLMDETFKALKFDTRPEHNLGRGRLMEIMRETAGRNYPKSCKAIAVVFAGHGNSDDCLCMQDGNTVTIFREIVEEFLPGKAPTIGSIPKLFFIDACRGDATTQSVTVPRGGGNKVATLRVPDQGNFLLAHSTMPNYEAYELKGKGGIWMTSLARKLRTSRKSVEDILSEVNQDMMQLFQSPEWSGRMQQPEKLSRLNEIVYLHPEVAAGKPEDFPGTTAPLLGLGMSNRQEAGLYRGLLHQMYQSGQITKPEFTSIEQKEGTRSLGFKGVVTFNIEGSSKKIESLEVESSKPLAQGKAAERAYRWLQSQGGARSAKSPQVINPVTSGSPVASNSVAPHPATGGSPNKTSASRLKEFCDKQRCGDPEYREVSVPEEQRFQFTVTVNAPQPVTAEGEVCSSKKDARQSANGCNLELHLATPESAVGGASGPDQLQFGCQPPLLTCHHSQRPYYDQPTPLCPNGASFPTPSTGAAVFPTTHYADAASWQLQQPANEFHLQTHDPACQGSHGTSQPLRPRYEYTVDHSGGQSRYRCALKVTMDGCPETITGGYHATSTSATQEAERKLAVKTCLEGLHSQGSTGSDCDYKSKLEQYFKLEGLARPKIHYRTRDHRGHQSTVTAPGMGSVKGDCCRNRAAAEQSAALHMLRKIQKYADE